MSYVIELIRKEIEEQQMKRLPAGWSIETLEDETMHDKIQKASDAKMKSIVENKLAIEKEAVEILNNLAAKGYGLDEAKEIIHSASTTLSTIQL